MEEEAKKEVRRFNRFLKILGPGLITGAADDDPSGIATYTQSGAQFGFGQLWTVLFTFPLMTAVQETCAKLGAVKGKGIAAIIKEYYSERIVLLIVCLVAFANIVNIGADIGAMTAAFQLIFPFSFVWIALCFAAGMLLLQITLSYKVYAGFLKWLALTLLAYPVTAFLVGLQWKYIIPATFVPHIGFTSDYLYLLTGVLGTTISPYMFFWQASEEVEEEIETRRLAKKGGKPKITEHFIVNVRRDNAIGMLMSQLTTWFIIIVGASVLHTNKVTNIASAADAAKALEPLVKNFPNAGFLSKIIFASGIIGLGLLAVPVLSTSVSYALSETFQWKKGLDEKFKHAKQFYAVIIFATLLGLAMNFSKINPIQALVFSAVVNGIASVPLLYILARLGSNENVMEGYHNGKITQMLMWVTFGLMVFANAGLLISVILKK